MLSNIIDTSRFPMMETTFQNQCKSELDKNGVLVLQGFLKEAALKSVKEEGEDKHHLAYYTASNHNIYLEPNDPAFSSHHPRNREIKSSKGCITDDQISEQSVLRELYDSEDFKHFLCHVLGEDGLHEYADDLSSINLHYAEEGKELGWHFDNSSFAITLLVQKPEGGGAFQYVKDVRDADNGEMNFEATERILDNKTEVQTLSMNEGDLVLFRGRNSMHRVTPTIGDITRILVVLAYNSEPNISLSKSARMTFYGRL